jgi:hypothetical protein
MQNWLKRTAIHPIILAIYPVLALFAKNVAQVDPSVVIRPLIISLATTLILFGLLSVILKNSQKAALLLSAGLTLFFSYGYVYAYLKTRMLFGLALGRHRFLATVWLIILIVVAWLILKKLKDSAIPTQGMNTFALILIIFPIFQLVTFNISVFLGKSAPSVAQENNLTTQSPDQSPDIYLIILDMYARQDVLLEKYDFDNSPFIDELRNMGFYVADCSLSNYSHTESSLASELNYDFIQNLLEESPQNTDHSPLWPLIKQSAVRQQLEAIGYHTIAFETGYPWSQLEDAYAYFKPTTGSIALSQINPFESLLISTTAGLLLSDTQTFLARKIYQDTTYLHINQQLFLLTKLEDIPVMKGPKFVFVHVIIPHQPFVFKADGSIQTDPAFYSRGWGLPIDNEHDIDGYRNQVAFINSRMIPILQNIISRSSVPPIILLQSDHGVEPYRNANLSAIYLPADGEKYLYQNISSVNTFRVIFNVYFGGHYNLLPDSSYTSSYDTQYDLSPYTDQMPGCTDQ